MFFYSVHCKFTVWILQNPDFQKYVWTWADLMAALGEPAFEQGHSGACRVCSHPMVYLWSITLPVMISNICCAPSCWKSMSSGSLNKFVVRINPECLTTGTVYLLLVLTNSKTKNQTFLYQRRVFDFRLWLSKTNPSLIIKEGNFVFDFSILSLIF